MLGAMFTLMIHVFSLFSENFKSSIKVINILDVLENSTHAIKRVSLHRTVKCPVIHTDPVRGATQKFGEFE
jgi:hypothetical protein